MSDAAEISLDPAPAVKLSPSPLPEEFTGLPGGFFRALARVALRACFLYPGVALLGSAVVAHLEGHPFSLVAWLVFGALFFLWPALYGIDAAAKPNSSAAIDFDPGAGFEEGGGPFAWLFRLCHTMAQGLLEGFGEVFAEGIFAGLFEAVAVFGLALVLMVFVMISAIAVFPFMVVLWSPSWLRFGLVLAPLPPLVGVFMLVAWIRLRRKMRGRDAFLAQSEEGAE